MLFAKNLDPILIMFTQCFFRKYPDGVLSSIFTLLFQSRVALQGQGERSFHIFYQLLNGADAQLLRMYRSHKNQQYYC